MAINYFTLLTKIGQASIANAIALGQKVNLTEMAIGDGNGNPTVPKESQTSLVNEVYRAQVNQLMTDPDNPNYLIAEMIVPTNVGGWSVREVGLFNDEENLIAIANFPETYKPKLEEGSGRDLVIRIILQVQSTDAVTLKIDPTVILASQAWVKENFTRAILLPGGTTGQILAKKSNANGDTEWKDIDIPEQINADWNATEGNAEILNKPTTLAGYGITDGASKTDLQNIQKNEIKTRVRSTEYSVGNIVNAPYIHDAILVCTTAGTTSDEELGEGSISVGADIEDGTVVWNVRNKFSTGLKRVEGTVSLDSHASQTGEYGCGNEQYFGHVKVVDDCFSNKLAADSVALSPYGAITAINNVMLGKTAGTITSSTNWTCPVSGKYTFTLVGGGGGGGGGSYNVYYTYSSGTRAASGGGGGGGGGGEVKTVSLTLEKHATVEIVIGGGGAGGNGGIGTTDTRQEYGRPGVSGQSGGNTSVSVSGTMHTAVGGGGGEGASGPTIANKNNIGGGGGAAGIHHSVGDAPARGTNGVGATSLAASIGGNGGKGGISGTSSIYSRYGNGGGGGAGKGYSTYGNAGYAQTLAQSGNGGNGGNGAQGMVHIILEAI